MRSVRRLLLLGSLLLAVPAPSAAEWQFTPFLGYTFSGATTLVDLEGATGRRHWNLGGAVTLVGDSPLGLEGYVAYTPGFFECDGCGSVNETNVVSSRTYAVMGNVLLTIPRHWNQYGLRPFMSGGLGLLHVASEDQLDVTPIRLNLVGMNLGGGATGFVTDQVGLRFDLRYFRKVQGPDVDSLEVPISAGEPIRLRYWTASLGVVFKY